MKILTVIETQSDSNRLPNKALLPILGEPVLIRLIERVRRSKLAREVVVAASQEPADDSIVRVCQKYGIVFSRGSSADLLDQHYKTGLAFKADALVKISSESPLIDPDIIDQVVGRYVNHPGAFDYVSNLHPATWPTGNSVEVIRMSALEVAWGEAAKVLKERK